jgi:signal peptidase II
MRAALLLLFLGLATVGCDQATKQVATRLEGEPGHEYLGGVVELRYAENPGAFLGLGNQLPDSARLPLLVFLNLGLLVGLGWWAYARPHGHMVRTAATLIIAGGVGNLLDRVLRDGGRVIDFLIVSAGPLRTGVFNVADMAVMLGVGVLFWTSFRRPATE